MRKILNLLRSSKRNIDILPIFIRSSWTFIILCSSENKTVFIQQIFLFMGECPRPPARTHPRLDTSKKRRFWLSWQFCPFDSIRFCSYWKCADFTVIFNYAGESFCLRTNNNICVIIFRKFIVIKLNMIAVVDNSVFGRFCVYLGKEPKIVK